MWYVKYHPKTIDDIISKKNKEFMTHMLDWMEHVDCSEEIIKTRGRPKKNDAVCQYKKPGIIIVGDTGVGKTAMMDIFANSCNADTVIFECQKMSKKNYETFFKQAVSYKNVTDLNRKKFIRFDDMESLTECDNVQISDIFRCIKNTKIPFIGTINSKHLNKISEFKRYVNIIHITPPTSDEMGQFIKRVYESEGRTSVPEPFVGPDIRLYLTTSEYGWSDYPDIFMNDGNKAITRLKDGDCVGYSVNNINIILHENYPYMDRSCKSIHHLATSDTFADDALESPLVEYIDVYGNRGALKHCDITTLRPASIWTKTSNMHYKKKLLKEKIKNENLDNTHDALTTYNVLRLQNMCI